MSLEHATRFVARLREDPEFRWALGSCQDAFEYRRFLARHGFRFSPAELVCATSPSTEPSAEKADRIERVRRAQGHAAFSFM